ncbi:MAG: hypothetical protein EZS28_027555, partial [Streblomastix strix]
DSIFTIMDGPAMVYKLNDIIKLKPCPWSVKLMSSQ